MGAHSLLSPSSAKRWLTCTPSAKLEAAYPDSSNDSAIEGTLAHAIAECMLKQFRNPKAKDVYEAELHALKYVSFIDHGKEIESAKYYSDAMLSYVEDYVAVVLSAMKPGAKLFIEERVDTTAWLPEPHSGGTMDAGVWHGKIFKFFDLKFGKRVAVDAYENDQLKTYALGVLTTFEWLCELEPELEQIEVFELNIYQPRNEIGHTTFVITKADLVAWGEGYVKPRAKLAYAGVGDFQPSVKACRFCKVKAVCKALAEFSLEPEEHKYKSPNLLSDDELIGLLERRELMSIWMNSIEDHIFAEAMRGKKWKGYKLVHSKTNACIVNERLAISNLLMEGYEPKQFMKDAPLKTLTDLRALLKKEFNTIMGKSVDKPKGEPTLAKEDDSREEYKLGFQVFLDNPLK